MDWEKKCVKGASDRAVAEAMEKFEEYQAHYKKSLCVKMVRKGRVASKAASISDDDMSNCIMGGCAGKEPEAR